MTKPTTVSHKSVCTVTRISSATLFYRPMVTTLCLVHGTRLCACGIWLPVKPPAASRTIPRCDEVLISKHNKITNRATLWFEFYGKKVVLCEATFAEPHVVQTMQEAVTYTWSERKKIHRRRWPFTIPLVWGLVVLIDFTELFYRNGRTYQRNGTKFTNSCWQIRCDQIDYDKYT